MSMAFSKNSAKAGAHDAPELSPELSVVAPVRNEAENIIPLIDEIKAALDGLASFEIVYVDDGSKDETPAVLASAAALPFLKVVRHLESCGQSAAIATGVKAARGALIVTIDGDGQNDPADIPKLLKIFSDARKEERDFLMVVGHRQKRLDVWSRRVASIIANRVRSSLLGDHTPDTGCGLKAFTRQAFLDMPQFDHMHRFLPALMIRRGGHVASIAVNHRARKLGTSNYGVFDRLWVGIADLFGVMWLMRRGRRPKIILPKRPKQ